MPLPSSVDRKDLPDRYVSSRLCLHDVGTGCLVVFAVEGPAYCTASGRLFIPACYCVYARTQWRHSQGIILNLSKAKNKLPPGNC